MLFLFLRKHTDVLYLYGNNAKEEVMPEKVGKKKKKGQNSPICGDGILQWGKDF